MGDGMQFVFQIDANTPGLDDLLGKLDKANVSMTKGHAGLKGLDAGAHHASEGAKEMTSAWEKAVSKGLDPFLEKAEKIAEFEFIREGVEKLLEFPEELGDKIKELGEEAIAAAAKTERMGLAFQNALGKDVGKEAFEYFDYIADKTEFTREQTRAMGLELAKAGFKGENLKNATAAVADLGAMSEHPFQGAMEAVEQLRHVITTGRAETRALVPFGIQKGEFEKELSKETGLGIKSAEKALEAGKIPLDTTLNTIFTAITNKSGETLGGLAAKMPETFESRMAKLKEFPDLLGDAFEKSRGFKELSDALGGVLKEIDPSHDPGKRIWTDIERILDHLPVLFDAAAAAAKGFGAVFGAAAGPGAALAATAGGYAVLDEGQKGAVKEGVYRGIYGHTHSELKAMPWWDRLGASISGPAKLIAGVVTGHHFDQPAKGDVTKAGANDVAGYSKGIQDATPGAAGAMTALADKTTDALKTAHEQHSPSALFRRIGELDVAGYTEGVRGGSGDVEAAMEHTFAPAVNAGAGGAGGGPMLSIDSIVVQVEGQGAGQDLGERIAAALEDQLEVMFIRLLERIAARKGG